MAVEIERKYLPRDDRWRAHIARSESFRQGYLSVDPPRTVRVRLIDDRRGFLTVKGSRVGDRRPEFEYDIPAEDARFMLDHLCRKPLIEKIRHGGSGAHKKKKRKAEAAGKPGAAAEPSPASPVPANKSNGGATSAEMQK